VIRYAFSLAFGLAIPLFSIAQDGALEINQACVPDGCFENDSPGFPVEIESPGSYRLTSNLNISGNNSAIYARMGATGAKIDLGGFTVSGGNECSGEPVTSCTSDNSSRGIRLVGDRQVLLNGAIAGFTNGVSCSGSCELKDLRISDNSDDGIMNSFVSNTNGVVLRDSLIEKNGGYGIALVGKGSLIENNIIRFNGDSGVQMWFTDSDGTGIFMDNTVTWNGDSSYFRSGMFVTRNNFDQEDGSSDFVNGYDAGDNACNGSAC